MDMKSFEEKGDWFAKSKQVMHHKSDEVYQS